MENKGLKSAHMGSVNSIFVSLEAGVVIGLEEDSIRVWDTVEGIELHVYNKNDADDSFVPGLSSIYRSV